ncbi:MAG: hypothetical protein ABJD97_08075 [Betaproteobacteria bacterium]
MIKTILFVHGTGVRKASFEQTAARVQAGLAGIQCKAALRPCLWGELEGARLALDGISIPEFQGVVAPEPSAQSLAALWELLAGDPLFELRELAGAAGAAGNLPPAAQALADEFPARVAALANDDKALALVAPKVLPKYWQDAVAAVAHSGELGSAIKAARTPNGAVRLAVARAIAAHLQFALGKDNFLPLRVPTRDQLVDGAFDELGGKEKGAAADWIKDRFKGLALRWATAQARRKRDVLFNGAYPAAGDILLYQVDGAAIRKRISDAIVDCGDDTAVIAHSLGGIACVDLLVAQSHPNVKLLVTCGSQAPLLYELGALRSLLPPLSLPDTFPPTWLNFYDRNDLLSYLAAPVFKGRAKDFEVSSGQPFPDSHSAYWDEDSVWSRLKPYL